MQKFLIFLAAGLLFCACSSQQTSEVQTPQTQQRSGRELFYSDSLNALAIYRTYPAPKDVKYTPTPKGYKPVYISTYARHGSRKLLSFNRYLESVMACADSMDCLTPLGKEVNDKVILVHNDQDNSHGDLTSKGVQQHRGIADRMYHNYPNIFSKKGTPVRLFSTNTQRTLSSMFAENEQLIKLNPDINSTRKASSSLWYLNNEYKRTMDPNRPRPANIIGDYFDAKPVLDKLFTGDVPALKDTVLFIRQLFDCARIIPGLDLDTDSYIWDLFSQDECFILQQAVSYSMYYNQSNSIQNGELALDSAKPLLKDFLDKADVALQEDVPGADLRFGHDSYLTPLVALIGINGYVKQEEDPLKVIDTFQDFRVTPMAANVQMVFYRNKAGDILVKFLHNEIESWIPIDTDMYPYYHWNDVREYFNSLIEG